MNTDLINYLQKAENQGKFPAKLSDRGGYITFRNSGQRGEAKHFQLGLESFIITLNDIKTHIADFQKISTYSEKEWRDTGSAFYTDPSTNAMATVQTKPLFSTLSKIIKWANQPTLDNVDSEKEIVLDNVSLNNAISKLNILADTYKPKSFTLIDLEDRNLILYGAPGTGKSTKIKKITGGSRNQTTVTFHPDSDYASFVGAYKPTKIGEDEDSKITYDFVPQAFTNAYIKAWKLPTTKHYLVIEEINRGNCAQIFGDIFQLLDRRCDGYSEYIIDIDSDLANHLKKELKGTPEYLDKIEEIYSVRPEDYSQIALPENLYILATMNTSDQSLFPMDSAFKRRWSWEYLPINYKDAEDFIIEIGDNKYNWATFLKFVNPIIKELTGSEDKQLGNRFVSPASKIISFNEFRSKILFYLWFEIFKEETGSSETIFKIVANDVGGEKIDKEIYFGDLFSEDRETDESLIKQFLEYNKVSIIK